MDNDQRKQSRSKIKVEVNPGVFITNGLFTNGRTKVKVKRYRSKKTTDIFFLKGSINAHQF